MHKFPDSFLWGVATSAYQIEGAAAVDGRAPSIWDVFSHTPGKVADGHTGDVACDHYHRFSEDIAIMKKLAVEAYRFSVSWSRVMPHGRGPTNDAGLEFYDRLIDGLLAAGIQPFVTLYHWDLPAALQMELGGWMHPDLPAIFADYASMMFDRYGDRVQYWMTINEPWCVVDGGYFCGLHAPGARNRQWGYQVGHNLLRAHAYAVARYRSSRHNTGTISFALNMPYSHPATDSSEDIEAAERAMQGFGGWFADPIYLGDYPAVMREKLGHILPEFTNEDARLLKGSNDFLALNYYLSEAIRHAPCVGDMETEMVRQTDKQHTAMDWAVDPQAFYNLLLWLSKRYSNPPIYITENGACFDDTANDNGFVDDQNRIEYLRDHLAEMSRAMQDGVDMRGYLAWSLLDNFEWSHGFNKRFGLVRCDFETGQRTIKASGQWYADFIKNSRSEEPITADDAARQRGIR